MYCELHLKTNFSFLSGASHADELVARAVELGYRALAVTDENTLAGMVKAYSATRHTDLKLIVGAEIVLNDAPPIVLWVTDRESYGRLSRLLTVGRRRAPKGQCWLEFQDVADHCEGLLAGVIPHLPGDRVRGFMATELGFSAAKSGSHSPNDTQTSSLSSWESAQSSPLSPWENDSTSPLSLWEREPTHERGHAIKRKPTRKRGLLTPPWWKHNLRDWRQLFGDRAYLLASLYQGVDDVWRLRRLRQLSQQYDLPLVAAGDVLYHVPARMPLHDMLTATKHRTTIASAGNLLLPNAQRHLKTIDQRRREFADFPDSIRRTGEIADRCSFCPGQLRYEYPKEFSSPQQTSMEFLRQLTWQGAKDRYPDGVSVKVKQQITHELTLIDELHYEAYFLTVWDLVRFARSRGILCQGRGSAANSAVCYCLGVTSVDPDTTDLLFERFISKERDEAPDIDVDFEHERREEVLQYLYEKYGRDRAGLAATVVTYRARSAVRDVGKALGLSLDRIDTLAKAVDGWTDEPKLAERMPTAGLDPESTTGRQLLYLVQELMGFPRHLSQHVGGMVMTEGRLDELVPVENASMDGRTVIQWDKNDLEELGLLKVDCLCLGMLTAIRKSFQLIEKHLGQSYDLATVPKEDPHVYDMICQADTIGVFQIESRAQMSMLPRLKPRCWYDLVIEVAIVRPGPIQGNMVHPFLRRRNGELPLEYPNEAIKAVLHRTLGVPIFQEQAMKLAVVAAGFTPGEADQLRRAMGAWRKSGTIEKFRHKLYEGMRKNGLNEEFADQVFNQIRGFGEYGFPESHAASFAKLVYVSSWIKCYHPAVFCAALLNSQPMGFYSPAQLVTDARQHNVTVLPVDVNHSDWDCTLEKNDVGQVSNLSDSRASDGHSDRLKTCPTIHQMAIRLGLRMISGLRQEHAETIMAARQNKEAGQERVTGREPMLQPFTSVAQFTQRTRLSQAVITLLSDADAFASVGQDRRAALWQALAQEKQPLDQPLFADLESVDDAADVLPERPLQQNVIDDYRTVGLSLKAHPISFHRDYLNQLRVTPINELQNRDHNRHLRVAGLVVLRQRPATAKGIMFVTLEDETGSANLVVKPKIRERYFQITRTSSAWIAHGKLERRSNVTHLVVNRIDDLSDEIGKLKLKTRNFR